MIEAYKIEDLKKHKNSYFIEIEKTHVIIITKIDNIIFYNFKCGI